MKFLSTFISLLAVASVVRPLEAQPDRVTVPFSDASRPKSLKVSLVNGSISVKGYDGKDAIVEAQKGLGRIRRPERERPDGLRRIDTNATGLTVEESDNVITVGTRTPGQDVSLNIQVPFDTSLKLHTVNGKEIAVDQITGDIEIDCTNGNATVTHSSGAAVVHALNGNVLVSLDKVSGDKPMSFSSLNGNIDVTLPSDAKARLRLKTDNGAVYSDFDIALGSSGRASPVEENKPGKGRYRVRFDRTMLGTINGGGAELALTTFNGSIYLRKAK
ncbi:MAG TPA: DUF4097 family beta strand repeat-containing protein [Bryobacteraceae bacterium]|nr:DUF4097 family beta strand repeat-containing protein [Bryobacteraceae bacterium]